jgi:hypothetical protein
MAAQLSTQMSSSLAGSKVRLCPMRVLDFIIYRSGLFEAGLGWRIFTVDLLSQAFSACGVGNGTLRETVIAFHAQHDALLRWRHDTPPPVILTVCA